MTTVVLGRPGAHASVLAARRARVVVVAAVVSVGCAAAFLATDRLWLLVPAAAGCLVARDRWAPVAKALAGARSERRVASALRRCGLAAVVHGARLGDGDADHVALGPVCAVVETKTGRGRLSTSGNKVRVGRSTLARDPAAQARRQAMLLSRRTGCHVDAVVCIVDLEGGPTRLGDVWVCSARDLAGTVSRLPHRLDPGRAVAVAHALAPQPPAASPAR